MTSGDCSRHPGDVAFCSLPSGFRNVSLSPESTAHTQSRSCSHTKRSIEPSSGSVNRRESSKCVSSVRSYLSASPLSNKRYTPVSRSLAALRSKGFFGATTLRPRLAQDFVFGGCIPKSSTQRQFNYIESKAVEPPVPTSVTIPGNGGPDITIETGQVARLADGAVIVRCGKTMLLATAVSSTKEPNEGLDFLPLSVDYQEKYSAAGRFPGGFLKRESKLSDQEVLVSRLIDRALRPLFPDDYHSDTQIMVTLISADAEVPPDALAGLAASAALAVSDIPFLGPISEVRVAEVDSQLVINPSRADCARARIDLIVSGSLDSINMVEGEMDEVSKEDMLKAILFAHDAIKKQCNAQLDLAAKLAVTKREYSHEKPDDLDLKATIESACKDKILEVARAALPKSQRGQLMEQVYDEWLASVPTDEENPLDEGLAKRYFRDLKKNTVRNMILDEQRRLDGRRLDEVRDIWTTVDFVPSAHGSAIFTRGETQALATITLGTKTDEQMMDGVLNIGYSKFMLHYNFPGYCTNEVKPNRAPGRREIGHGNLAARAIKRIMPPELQYPYTVRVTSDVLESNGSSSMATVCAGSLALMDAGVPVKRQVAGIAMGLISRSASDSLPAKYAVLSDILGDEDHLGDMDFKVAGTSAGITACQMDIKVEGLTHDLLAQALDQAERGRQEILSIMDAQLASPRDDMKPHAPRVQRFVIPRMFVGAIIGPGGKHIQQIQRETGSVISIDDHTTESDKSTVEIQSMDSESGLKAATWITNMTVTPEIGKVYDGVIKTITAFGAFVEFLPNKDGLLHISEVTWQRLPDMEGLFKEGEKVQVKLIEVDEKTGKYKLSRKVLLEKPAPGEPNPDPLVAGKVLSTPSPPASPPAASDSELQLGGPRRAPRRGSSPNGQGRSDDRRPPRSRSEPPSPSAANGRGL